MTEPFWAAGYRDSAVASVFGRPSEEIADVVRMLPPGASALDLGCGDGRNAVYLLEQGLHVTAIDQSPDAVATLRARAARHANRLVAAVGDVRVVELAAAFDLVIAHGLLHLLRRSDWSALLTRMQEHTRPLGYNVAAVFTDALPPPKDLRPFLQGLFREGELLERYRAWNVLLQRSYVLEDEHPGGVRHRHPVNKVVAQKPEHSSQGVSCGRSGA
jgi:tellurite methyltransferase